MNIKNNSNQKVRCVVDTNINVLILPYETKEIHINKAEVSILLEHTYESSYGHCFNMKNVCQIVINTCFFIQQVTDKSIININREKVHFEFLHTYDRFFCIATDCYIVSERHFVSGMDQLSSSIQHEVKKDTFGERLLTFFLSGPFVSSTVLFFLFKIPFALNGWPFSWLYIFLFWVLAFALQIVGEKIYYLFPNNRKTDQYKWLVKYTAEEAIRKYYSNPDRGWIGHDIETS